MIRTIAVTALATLALCASSFAQDYPSKPVTIVVGFGKGGPDTNARLLAAQLNMQTGKTFVVENKPGAAGIIGATYVAQAAPDGYTILMTSASIGSLPAMHKELAFDLMKDFEPVSMVSASEASFLVVNPDFPPKSLKELLDYTKDHEVSYSSTGIGTGSHLRMALFTQANNIKMTHIPFKSPGEALTSLMNGETQVQFVTASQGVPLIREGKVRPLAYDYDTRPEFLPDVPTIVEAGAAPTGLDSGWNGILVPAGTPPEAKQWLETEIRKAVQNPDLQEKLKNIGLIPVGSSSEEFGVALARAVESMGAAVKAAGIEPK